jgi:hypothetical protein
MFLIHSLEIVAMLSCVLCIVSIVREGERVREREIGEEEAERRLHQIVGASAL